MSAAAAAAASPATGSPAAAKLKKQVPVDVEEFDEFDEEDDGGEDVRVHLCIYPFFRVGSFVARSVLMESLKLCVGGAGMPVGRL